MEQPTVECLSELQQEDTWAVIERRGATTERGMKQLADRIVKIRKQKGVTQVELAKHLGISQPVVSNMEKGLLRYHGEVVVKLARLFRISTDELLGAKPIKNDQPIISRRWLRRLKRIEQLSKRDQDGLIQTVDRYLKAAKCQ